MVDFSLFKQANFLGTVFAMQGYAGGAQVVIFYLPVFLQNVHGFFPGTREHRHAAVRAANVLFAEDRRATLDTLFDPRDPAVRPCDDLRR